MRCDIFQPEARPVSVIKSKRNVSQMEFLHKARELEIYTIKKCINFPKRYTFHFTQFLTESSVRIYENVKKANSVFPQNQHEAQMRRDYLLRARCELQSMISQLEVAQEIFGLPENVMEFWVGLIAQELDLLRGVLSNDSSRYKNLRE